MRVAVGVVAGVVAGRLLLATLLPTLRQPALTRVNYRGVDVTTAAGVVVPLTVVVVEALAALVGAGDGGTRLERSAVVLVAVGLGLAGLLDDLAGGDDARGFRGHLSALAAGRLTTGGAKLVAGAAVAVAAVAAAGGRSAPRLLADAALVALAANLGNLFDRRPGRVTKVALAAFAALVAATAAAPELGAVAVVVGAGAALLPEDLGERMMLGDTGANVLGGALGLGVVLACSPGTRTAVLVVVAALNVASEAVSFGRVIDAVPPLRALDRWGRRA